MWAAKYDITYSTERLWNKDLFVFVNHKVATLCWAVLGKKHGLCDVLTFDAHRDYRDGVVIQQDCTLNKTYMLSLEERVLFSKHNKNSSGAPHFTISKEFMDWDPLDESQNNRLIGKEHKYFLPNNDNFIDAAFMKAIVRNVHCYYFETRNRADPGKCDDVFGTDHFFEMNNIKEFEKPVGKFILDIDLDFFIKYRVEGKKPFTIIAEPRLSKYLELIRGLSQQESCVGITLALEPGCCGSIDNSLRVCEHLGKVFGIDLIEISRKRLSVNNKLKRTFLM